MAPTKRPSGRNQRPFGTDFTSMDAQRPDALVHNLDPCVSDTHNAPSRQRGPSPHTIPDAYLDMHYLLFEQAIAEVLGCRLKLVRAVGQRECIAVRPDDR